MNQFDMVWLMTQVWICGWTIEDRSLMQFEKSDDGQAITVRLKQKERLDPLMRIRLFDNGLSLLDQRYSLCGAREDGLDSVEVMVRLRGALKTIKEVVHE